MGVPLSWRDAKPLLENMDGPVAPDSWQGGLPLKYRLGGKRVQVHLKVDMDTSVQPYYVTEARIRGSEAPDQWVILGIIATRGYMALWILLVERLPCWS